MHKCVHKGPRGTHRFHKERNHKVGKHTITFLGPNHAMINSLSKTDDFIKMINLFSKTDVFIKIDKFT